MLKTKAPTKRKTVQKMIGSVPYSTVVKGNDKGRYIATANIGGKKYEASGDNPRLATLALTKQVDSDAQANDIPHL